MMKMSLSRRQAAAGGACSRTWLNANAEGTKAAAFTPATNSKPNNQATTASSGKVGASSTWPCVKSTTAQS